MCLKSPDANPMRLQRWKMNTKRTLDFCPAHTTSFVGLFNRKSIWERNWGRDHRVLFTLRHFRNALCTSGVVVVKKKSTTKISVIWEVFSCIDTCQICIPMCPTQSGKTFWRKMKLPLVVGYAITIRASSASVFFPSIFEFLAKTVTQIIPEK